MAKLQYRTISKRTVDGLSVDEKDVVFWDRELPGFGVRVYPSGSKVYVVQTRARGKSKRVTLGRHGVISADQARRKAAETIARIKSGEDPEGKPASTVTVADVAARYLKEHVALHCKPGTAKLYRSVVERFILPAYGNLPVEDVDRDDIAELHYDLRETPYQANRVLEIGNKLFNLAELWKLRTGSNPCKFVRKYREKKRERFLTDEEFRRLGDVLNEMEADKSLPVYPAAAIRLLMLTGCRRNEIVTLKWEHVDLEDGELRLPDSKTGARMVPLSQAAARVLAELPRIQGRCPALHLVASDARCSPFMRGFTPPLTRQRGCWRSCRASRAIPGLFPASSRTGISPISTTIGTGCATGRSFRTCASTTSGIHSPRGRSRSARA